MISSQQNNLEPNIFNKKYDVINFIASGFFGYVYKVKDIETDKM
jgi:hypothetical protein